MPAVIDHAPDNAFPSGEIEFKYTTLRHMVLRNNEVEWAEQKVMYTDILNILNWLLFVIMPLIDSFPVMMYFPSFYH